jgi:hypothetical protein
MQTTRPDDDIQQFRASTLALSPQFPAWQFRSGEEFAAFLKEHQSVLDTRHLYQLSLATADERLEQSGTCAVCRCPTVFDSAVNGERLNDGKRLPNWREEMRCACARRLTSRERAVLHLAQACGLLNWSHSLLLGASEGFARVYMQSAPDALLVPRFQFANGIASLPAESGSCHFVVSQDDLQDIEPLKSAMAELARILVQGGRLIFTVPFHVANRTSDCGTGGGVRPNAHKFGWDLLDMLKATGFSDASALLYWSEELGYLGNMNFAFFAVK